MASDEEHRPTEEEGEDLDALWSVAGPRRVVAAQQVESSEEDSYFQGSEGRSEGSAERRERDAEERLRAHEEATSRPAAGAAPPPALLPSAGAAFAEVDGPPAFLDPEATRPLATTVHRPSGGGGGNPRAANQATNKRGQAAGEWDISRMAPQLKEEGHSEPGVIKGAAVRYNVSDDRAQPSAAAIAMLGGTAGGDAEDGGGQEEGTLPGAARPGGGAGPGKGHPQPKGKATAAMAVDKFLEKGVGGAQLPRKRQDRKDKEKDKRVRGQSTHSQWKSEAEMVLRQQFD